jgi:hypothetical protein
MAKKKMGPIEQLIYDRAMAHLGKKYKEDYVKKRMATKSYPPEWDAIIEAYTAGADEMYTQLFK